MTRVQWRWAAILATGLSLLNSVVAMWVYADNGQPWLVFRPFAIQGSEWYVWLALLPLIHGVVRKAQDSRGWLRPVAIHIAGGLAIVALLQIPVHAFLAWLLSGMPATDGVIAQLRVSYSFWLEGGIFAYGLIAAALHALHYFEDVERQYVKMARVEHETRHGIEVLAGTAAHDFNNLLTVIGGNAALLEMTEPAEQQALVHDIEAGARRASAVARHLLALSQGIRVRPVLMDLLELVGYIEASMRELLGPGTELDIEAIRGRLPIEADPELMRLVLSTMVEVVAEGMAAGQVVSVRVDRTADGRAEVTVVGAGQAPDPAALARIFEPGASTRRVGHGLGLAAAQAIVERSGGTIDALGEPGRGTVLKLHMPLSVEVAENTPTDSGFALHDGIDAGPANGPGKTRRA